MIQNYADIKKSLALSDVDARIADINANGNGNISYKEIHDYHLADYADNGVSENAWAGKVLDDLGGFGTYMEGIDPAIMQW